MIIEGSILTILLFGWLLLLSRALVEAPGLLDLAGARGSAQRAARGARGCRQPRGRGRQRLEGG